MEDILKIKFSDLTEEELKKKRKYFRSRSTNEIVEA